MSLFTYCNHESHNWFLNQFFGISTLTQAVRCYNHSARSHPVDLSPHFLLSQNILIVYFKTEQMHSKNLISLSFSVLQPAKSFHVPLRSLYGWHLTFTFNLSLRKKRLLSSCLNCLVNYSKSLRMIINFSSLALCPFIFSRPFFTYPILNVLTRENGMGRLEWRPNSGGPCDLSDSVWLCTDIISAQLSSPCTSIQYRSCPQPPSPLLQIVRSRCRSEPVLQSLASLQCLPCLYPQSTQSSKRCFVTYIPS